MNILHQKFTLLLGSYYLRQTESYLHEHFNPSEIKLDEIELFAELYEQYHDLVRILFPSRHSNQKFYIATVQYGSDEDEQIQD